jgi:hypothetical protein
VDVSSSPLPLLGLFSLVGSVGVGSLAFAALTSGGAGSIPLIGGVNGGRSARLPYQPHLLNTGVSYDDEFAALTAYALQRGLTRFSALVQNTSEGAAAMEALTFTSNNHAINAVKFTLIPQNATSEIILQAIDEMRKTIRPQVKHEHTHNWERTNERAMNESDRPAVRPVLTPVCLLVLWLL